MFSLKNKHMKKLYNIFQKNIGKNCITNICDCSDYKLKYMLYNTKNQARKFKLLIRLQKDYHSQSILKVCSDKTNFHSIPLI